MRADQLQPHDQIATVLDAVTQAYISTVLRAVLKHWNAQAELLRHSQLALACAALNVFVVGELRRAIGQTYGRLEIHLLLGFQRAADFQECGTIRTTHFASWSTCSSLIDEDNIHQVVLNELGQIHLTHLLAIHSGPCQPLRSQRSVVLRLVVTPACSYCNVIEHSGESGWVDGAENARVFSLLVIDHGHKGFGIVQHSRAALTGRSCQQVSQISCFESFRQYQHRRAGHIAHSLIAGCQRVASNGFGLGVVQRHGVSL